MTLYIPRKIQDREAAREIDVLSKRMDKIQEVAPRGQIVETIPLVLTSTNWTPPTPVGDYDSTFEFNIDLSAVSMLRITANITTIGASGSYFQMMMYSKGSWVVASNQLDTYNGGTAGPVIKSSEWFANPVRQEVKLKLYGYRGGAATQITFRYLLLQLR